MKMKMNGKIGFFIILFALQGFSLKALNEGEISVDEVWGQPINKTVKLNDIGCNQIKEIIKQKNDQIDRFKSMRLSAQGIESSRVFIESQKKDISKLINEKQKRCSSLFLMPKFKN